METDITNKKRKLDADPLRSILKILRDPSLSAQKDQALQDFQNCSVSYLIEQFDECINALQVSFYLF